MESQCEVCFVPYNVDYPQRVPKVLTCGHTFCSKCLGYLIADDAIRCPVCRCTIPGIKTIADVRNNFTLIEIITQRDVHPKCKDHHEDLKLFCSVDQTFICHVCLTPRGSHAGHQVEDPTDVSIKYKARLKDDIGTLKSHISEVNEFSNEITLRTTALYRDGDRAKAKIQKQIGGLIETLNARKILLLQEVQRHQKDNEKILKDDKSKAERSISELQECHDKANAILNGENDVAAVTALMEITPRIDSKLNDIHEFRSKLDSLKTVRTNSGANSIDVQLEDITKSLRCFGEVITADESKDPTLSHALASAPVVHHKNMIGEIIFPLIQQKEPTRAGKITGMLLELDNGELLRLLESPNALALKIAEALEVLQKPTLSQALASAPVAHHKNMIGERIFPLIRQKEPTRAGKITGMLLELDNGELLRLLESPNALALRIDEALEVLQKPMPQPTPPSSMQKYMIGERIFPLIHRKQPALAGKITGMLLGMDNSELLHLLESPAALAFKIDEAVEALQRHGHSVTQDMNQQISRQQG